MKRPAWLFFLATTVLLRAADPAPDPLEQKVRALIAGPDVTDRKSVV